MGLLHHASPPLPEASLFCAAEMGALPRLGPESATLPFAEDRVTLRKQDPGLPGSFHGVRLHPRRVPAPRTGRAETTPPCRGPESTALSSYRKGGFSESILILCSLVRSSIIKFNQGDPKSKVHTRTRSS